MISALPPARLAEYAGIRIAYRVTARLVPDPGSAGGRASFHEVPVAHPYEKDYDHLADSAPLAWPSRFALDRWGLLLAQRDGLVCGGAAIAPLAEVMDGSALPGDSAVLWDLRVAPESRGQGVGAALFVAARSWAHEKGFAGLLVETQDTNVPACRFYLKMGCRVISYEPAVYESLPDEARLIFHCPHDAPAHR